ncbi:hypothetical protein BKA61DRAFT_677380 [Leptodontidium sp. MPI-SDFR-AT-0119]|nr:hypothetical protein BKA61DRAFT_677380 [Leptodontidium sp. MPI-SDFR-AT-0119]
MTPRHIRQQAKDAQRAVQEAKRAAKLERATAKAERKAEKVAKKAERLKVAILNPELQRPNGGLFHREPKTIMTIWRQICPVAPYEGLVAAHRAILTSTLLSKAEITADHFMVEEDILSLSGYARVLVAATESQIDTWRTSPLGRGLAVEECTLVRKDMSELPEVVTRCFHRREVDLSSEETRFILLTRYQAKRFAALEELDDIPRNFFLLRKRQNVYSLKSGDPPGRSSLSAWGWRTSRLRRWRELGDDCYTYQEEE